MLQSDRVKVAYRILNSAQRLEDQSLIHQAKKVLKEAAKNEENFTVELTIFNRLKDSFIRQTTRGRKPNY